MISGSHAGIYDQTANFHSSAKRLASAILVDAAKQIKHCPETLLIYDTTEKAHAKAKLVKALDAFRSSIIQPGGQSPDHDRIIFWCEVAEVHVDWFAKNMKTLAESNSLLMKAWEAENAVEIRKKPKDRERQYQRTEKGR